MLSIISLFRIVSLRYLRQRWDRAALITASIALGVAMLVSTQLVNQCLEAASSESVTPGADIADLVVSSNRRVKLELLEPLQRLPGVASAQPMIIERVLLPEYGNRTAVLIGLDASGGNVAEKNPFQATVQLTNPAAWLSGRGVVIGRELAAVLSPDGKPTKPFEVRAGGRVHTLQPGGVVELKGKAEKLGGFLLVMDVRQAAIALNQPGICERIDLYLDPGADRAAVRAAAQELIGNQAIVRTPEAAGRAQGDIVGPIRIMFTLCGVGAMVVGLFLVYNALAVSVAERRHDIGVLRSMGATRRQIASLFTGESVVLGLVGALLGVPIGMLIARFSFYLVQTEMQQLFLTAKQPLDVSWETFFFAVGSGMLTAWLAALVPAMQAASDEPADAVRRAPSSAGRFFRYLQVGASFAMVTAGLSFVLIREYLPKRVGGYGGMVLLLVGMLLAVPFFVGLMARLIQPLTRRLFGIEVRLASDNLLRAPGRTGVVVGALAAGVALMFQTAGIGKSNKEPVLDWLDRALSSDFFVICGDPSSTTSMLPMQPDVARELRELPGVEETMSLRYRQMEFQGKIVWLTALDAKVYHDANRHSSRLPHLHLFPKLVEPNTCLVSDNFAALYKVKAGELIELQNPSGPVTLRILGVIQDYTWARGTILVNRAFYAKAFNDNLIDGVHIFLKPDDREAGWQRVKEFTDSQALVIVTREDFSEIVASFIRRIYTLAYVQQIAVGLVAALGVVMALVISVLQRRRELGLLRAVGATQGQVLHTVLAEAMLMGVLGTFLGVLAGILLEWYLLRVVIYEESGFLFPVMFPWFETLVLAVVAIVTATVAGLFPAIHAVRLHIAEAIAYE